MENELKGDGKQSHINHPRNSNQLEDFTPYGLLFPLQKGILNLYLSHRNLKSSPSKKKSFNFFFLSFFFYKCIAQNNGKECYTKNHNNSSLSQSPRSTNTQPHLSLQLIRIPSLYKSSVTKALFQGPKNPQICSFFTYCHN